MRACTRAATVGEKRRSQRRSASGCRREGRGAGLGPRAHGWVTKPGALNVSIQPADIPALSATFSELS